MTCQWDNPLSPTVCLKDRSLQKLQSVLSGENLNVLRNKGKHFEEQNVLIHSARDTGFIYHMSLWTTLLFQATALKQY